MRKFRNPRYAPESLERKLSPSGLVGNLAAVVYFAPADDGSGTQAPPTPPPPGNGPPPPTPPPAPQTGPGGPA